LKNKVRNRTRLASDTDFIIADAAAKNNIILSIQKENKIPSVVPSTGGSDD
jgi:hypothetical protein